MRFAAALLTLTAVIAAGALCRRHERAADAEAVTIFSVTQRGCPIVVPMRPIDAERRAASMIQATLARSAGCDVDDFPIVTEGRGTPRRAVFVGETERGIDPFRERASAPFDTAVAAVARDGALFLRSERRESIASAAGWFLEKHVGAHWFIPGPLGEHVPRHAELTLPAGEEAERPGFVHRDLGVDGPGADEWNEWYARNRLESRLEHHHNLANIFRPGDFRRAPEMAPMRGGQRYIPTDGDQNWQPNMLSRAAVEHAAAVANRTFDREPGRLSFPLSINDTVRFDDSAATLAAVAPARFFRFRPDYSNLVFRFTNAVAERVAQRHPDRWLPAYAYYWCENAPDFRIAPNVVPFLTADRSRWSFPDFAAEDRALIEKWCRSGARIVGVYDYVEGAPYLVPRPLIYAVSASIPFEHRAGVRAFFGEGDPNWALDGPKSWLAAQLLWSPQRDPRDLLEIYYGEFWAETAEPMRRFFGICEDVWQHQPGPPLWLRYFQDDDQSHIYSPQQRRALRAELIAAAKLASSDTVRARVAFTTAAFDVFDAFAEFCAARDRVNRLTREPPGEPAAMLASWQRYREARADFRRRFDECRRKQPLALAQQQLELYLRNEPDGRVARALSRTGEGRAMLHASDDMVARCLEASEPEITGVLTRGVETLQDPGWRKVSVHPVDTSAMIDCIESTVWRGSSEPWEGRSIKLMSGANGERVLRVSRCRTDDIGQWAPAIPRALYAAQVKVRAKTSPGTRTLLIVSFLDQNGRYLGSSRVDRLPADSAVQESELCVIVRAPAEARMIGFGLSVWNQINDDFAEFSGASLRRLDN